MAQWQLVPNTVAARGPCCPLDCQLPAVTTATTCSAHWLCAFVTQVGCRVGKHVQTWQPPPSQLLCVCVCVLSWCLCRLLLEADPEPLPVLREHIVFKLTEAELRPFIETLFGLITKDSAAKKTSRRAVIRELKQCEDLIREAGGPEVGQGRGHVSTLMEGVWEGVSDMWQLLYTHQGAPVIISGHQPPTLPVGRCLSVAVF